MTSFLRHFRVSFRHSIEASFILIERDTFHYMAELSGRLVASQESNQAWHVECGCQRAFIFIFPVYFALSNISLFPTDFAVFCSVTCKGESSQHKQFPCNRKLLIYVFLEACMKTCYIVLVLRQSYSVDIFCLLQREEIKLQS